MKECSKTYVIALLLILKICTAADKTLFDDKDEVIVYKENNYQQELYDGVRAHTFLLYSSWCGHCQRFAPVYK
jgi:thiol oxidase